MKRIISLVLCVFLLLGCCAVFGGCSSDSMIDVNALLGTYTKDLAGTTLNVYNWGEYISDGEDGALNIVKEFENLTGIDVSYTTYDSNESMYSIMRSGSVSYDIIIPSDYMIARMKTEGLLKKIDVSKLKNYNLIDDRYKGMYYDENDEYSVPYNVGLVGIIYNQTMVEEAPDSWSCMFDERYKGQLLTFNNPRDAFMISQMYQGISLNTTDLKEWDKSAELLMKQKDLLKMYVMDKVFDMMETGEAAIAPYYAGDFVTMLESNSDLRFAYPKEGTNIFVDAVCIPECAENVEAAMMFIDFLLEPQIAMANADYISYASPNTAVSKNEEYLSTLTVELDDGTEFDYSRIIYPEEKDMPYCEYYYDMDETTRAYYESLWNKIVS